MLIFHPRGLFSVATLIFSNIGPPTNLLLVELVGTCRLKSVSWRMEVLRHVSMAPHNLVGHQNVVNLRFVLIYRGTPPTHYYLESSGHITYIETCPHRIMRVPHKNLDIVCIMKVTCFS
jgi:hypothetical protein